MRALLAHPGPHFSVDDVYTGWGRGLADNGVTTAEFNLGDRLIFFTNAQLEKNGEMVTAFERDQACELAASGIEALCYRWWPDVIVIVSGFFIAQKSLEIMKARGHKIVILHTESPYEDDVQVDRARWADLNIINDPTNIDRFREVAPTIYLPHAHDPRIHHPRQAKLSKLSDLFFCGTGYRSRVRFLEQCDFTGLNVKLGGCWPDLPDSSPLASFLVNSVDECMPNTETHDWYASTLASLNLYRHEANRPDLTFGWSMGPREVELAASGTFFLREPRGESNKVLPMLPTFTSPQDFTDKLHWWLAHDDERQAAADKARAAVQDRTFTAHAAEMLQTLGI